MSILPLDGNYVVKTDDLMSRKSISNNGALVGGHMSIFIFYGAAIDFIIFFLFAKREKKKVQGGCEVALDAIAIVLDVFKVNLRDLESGRCYFCLSDLKNSSRWGVCTCLESSSHRNHHRELYGPV